MGYGGVVERQAVAEGADWHVRSFDELRNALAKHSVAFIGSGELVLNPSSGVDLTGSESGANCCWLTPCTVPIRGCERKEEHSDRALSQGDGVDLHDIPEVPKCSLKKWIITQE